MNCMSKSSDFTGVTLPLPHLSLKPVSSPHLISWQQLLLGGVGVASGITLRDWTLDDWTPAFHQSSPSHKRNEFTHELYTQFTFRSASLFTVTQQKHISNLQAKHFHVSHNSQRCCGPQAQNTRHSLPQVTQKQMITSVLAHSQGCEPLISSSTNNSLMFKLKSNYLVLNSQTRDIPLTVWSQLLRKGATLPSPSFLYCSQAGKQRSLNVIRKHRVLGKTPNICVIQPTSVFKTYFRKYKHPKQNWPLNIF